MKHAPTRAAVLAALSTLARTQPTTTNPTTADLLAAAHLAQQRGAQADFLANAYKLRDLTPDDPTGWLLLGIGHASFGPGFAKDVAQHAFAQTLTLTQPDLPPATTQRLLALISAYAPNRSAARRANPDTLRDLVNRWRADLAAGKTLLLAADKTALARASARADRRVQQVADFATIERDKLARIRKDKKVAERELQRERSRKRRLGEGLRDLQPYADRIASCARTIAVCERTLREHETDLEHLRAEAKRLATRLAELE